MDFKNYPNMRKLRDYPKVDHLGYLSNTNIALNNKEDYTTKNPNLGYAKSKYSRNNNERYNILDDSIRSAYLDTSNEIINDNRQFYTKAFVNPSYKEQRATVGAGYGFDQSYSQPRVYLSPKDFETSYPKNDFSKRNNSQEPKYKHSSRINRFGKVPNMSVDSNRYIDEDVHSRFQQNKFDDVFVHRTPQTNARLQKILDKVIKECRRDKPRKSWNDYINELKDKHGYYNDTAGTTKQYTPEDIFNTEVGDLQSDPVQNLLNDIYGCDTNVSTNIDFSSIPQLQSERVYFKNNNVCYPTSSQALINMKKNVFNEECYGGNRIVIDPNFERYYKQYLDKIFKNQVNHVKEMVVQTEINFENFKNYNVLDKEENTTNTSRKTSNIIKPLKRKLLIDKGDTDVKSFEEVEMKLDNLIKSVNSVILAVRTLLKPKEITTDSKARPIPDIESLTDDCNDSLNVQVSGTKNNIREIYQTNKDYITMVLQNTNRQLKISEIGTSMSQFREFTMRNMDKVIEEEMEKSKRIKRDIQELLHTRCDRQCSVQLTIDIPTKESKDINCHESDIYFEETNRSIKPEADRDTRKMSIAINTDPLSLQALLRVSTDAIKGLLSYVPHIDYNTCVSMLPVSRSSVPNYICYICGDSFSHMSQLTDHVRQHNLRRMRSSCVCRHVLCVQCNQIGQFECKYCDKRFTRSYCCELHQKNCAKKIGKKHLDLSSLLYLK